MLLRSLDDIFNFIFEICSGQADNSLGMVCRNSENVELENVTIEQSLSLLYQHSTGAMVWNTTPKFSAWVKTSPLRELVFQKTVVELGSGTGALATLLSDFTAKFIATDQRPLLKLCRRNCDKYNSLPRSTNPIVVREFDWETQDFNNADINEEHDPPVTVVACDTIYNEFLQRPFLRAVLSVWMACESSQNAVIAVQLRDATIMEQALTLFFDLFNEIETFNISPGFLVILLSRKLLRGTLRESILKIGE